MDFSGNQVLNWSWENTAHKTMSELLLRQFSKANRTEKIETSRKEFLQNGVIEEKLSMQKNGFSKEIHETEIKDHSNALTKHKSLTMQVQEAFFLKHSLSSLFKKTTLKIKMDLKMFILELDSASSDKNPNVLHAKIEIRFADTLSLVFPKDSEFLAIDFRNYQVLVENAKKKGSPWATSTLQELLQKEDFGVFPEIKTISVKLLKTDIVKIQNQKLKFLEFFKSQNITIKEEHSARSKSLAQAIPFKEINNETDIQKLQTHEQNILRIGKNRRLEAFLKIGFPKFPLVINKRKVCPIYTCFKEFSSVVQLKNHISQEHKVLETSGIEIDSNGQISYPDHIIERALLTTYMFGTMVNEKVLKVGKKLETDFLNQTVAENKTAEPMNE